MTPQEILTEFREATDGVPVEAMKAAVAQREEVVPELLKVLESMGDGPEEWGDLEGTMLPVMIVYLLAELRERRAYPLITKLLSIPGEAPFELFGDLVTEEMPRVLASIYDGNVALLHALIEGEAVNDYVRDLAVGTLVILERNSLISRDEVVAYFRALFHGRLPRTPSFAWVGLLIAVTNLPAPELIGEVRQAYADGLMDSTIVPLATLENDILDDTLGERVDGSLISDAVMEVESLNAFGSMLAGDFGGDTEGFDWEDAKPPLDFPVPQPFVRGVKTGRNDPCPCGSGKKWKRCCGKNE